MSTGDDLATGLDNNCVILHALLEIFNLQGDSGVLFAALFRHREVAEDVTTGVADEAGDVGDEVVGGGVDDPVVLGSQERIGDHFGTWE